jgi:serine/threonine protein phosphatase PrpC
MTLKEEDRESMYGYQTVGGVAPGFFKENQDAYLYKSFRKAAEEQGLKSKDFFAAVMDGHGMHGKEVSGFVKERLSQGEFHHRLKSESADSALKWAFEKTASDLKQSGIDCRESGSTTVSCLRQGSDLITANVGDSRAVLARFDGSDFKAVDLSSDHKPERKDEMERIIRMRGQVEPSRAMGGRFVGPARVWAVKQQVGGLAVSRAIGDTNLNCVGVIPTPEIMRHTVGDNDKFVILASDGVWEHLSSQDAVNIAKKYWNNPSKASDVLVAKAREAWGKERCGYRDDITAVVVKLD